MKLLFPIVVTLAVAVTATAAPAFDRVVHTTVVKTDHHDSDHHDNGPQWRTKRVCKVSWDHHRKVNHCWTTRVRV